MSTTNYNPNQNYNLAPPDTMNYAGGPVTPTGSNFGPGYTGAPGVDGGEGLGLYDLYNTYSHIDYLFGDTLEGQELGLEAYDPFNEDLLRKKYREDYRGMVADVTQSNQEQSLQMNKLRSEGGRAGFAGAGIQQQNIDIMSSSFDRERKKQKGGFSTLNQSLMGDINKERQSYETGLWNAYTTWLSNTPEQLDESLREESNICLDNGGVWNGSECITPNTDGSTAYESGYSLWADGS